MNTIQSRKTFTLGRSIELGLVRCPAGWFGLIGAAALALAPAALAQTTTTFTTAGNSTWTCPSNVFSVQVETTGGGGGGGGTLVSGTNVQYGVAGGGAGGSYVRYTVNVTPGTVYNLTVGAGGAGGTNSTTIPYTGNTGGSSYFGNSTAGSPTGASVLAVGGPGGTGNTTGYGTSSNFYAGLAGGVGTTTGNIPASGAAANLAGTSGGTSVGGAEGTAASGAGGAGAPSSGAGGTYTGGAGGAAVVSTSAGSKPGNNGTAAGGGGSGAADLTLSKAGGAGATGKVALTYTVQVPSATNSTVIASTNTLPADGATTATITVTLKDTNSDLIAGKTVTLTSSRGATDTISPASATTTSSGVLTFTVKSATGGTAVLTAADTTDAITLSQTVTMNFAVAGLSYFTVTPSASSAAAGQVFTATVQAYNTSSNAITDSSLNGVTVTMTSLGSAQFDANGDGIYGDNVKALTNGAFTINVRDLKAESVAFTATSGTSTGSSSSVTIGAAPFAQLQLLLPGETAAPGTTTGKTGTAATETAGVGFSFTVNAVDTNWNLVSSSDTLQIVASNAPLAILPANTALTAGTATLTATNLLAGSGKSLTASDVSNGGITAGTSSTYSVVPGSAYRLLVLAPGETAALGSAPGKTGTPSNQTPTVGYTVTVDALDAYYNLATNNGDTVGIKSSDGTATLPANAALVGGTKTFTLSNNAVGTFTVTGTNISTTSVLSGSSTVTTTNIATTTTLATSLNPAFVGQTFKLTATVSGPGTHTGTVTFKSGSTNLGTSTLSGSTASYAASGGVGTYSLTAVYNGDSNNLASTSSPVSEVIQSGPIAAGPAALMQDGQDYAAGEVSSPTLNAPWIFEGATSTTVIGILAGNLTGTSANAAALGNISGPTGTPAHLIVGASTTSAREYFRSLSNSVTSGSVYLSFLLDMGADVTHTDEAVLTLLPAGASNAPTGLVDTDPLSMHVRTGSTATNYNLGVERLGGTTAWATNNLVVGNTYLVVLEYTFGGTCQLFIDPAPGFAQPTASATTAAGGTDPANIGTVLCYEGDSPFQTSGVAAGNAITDGYNYDVMRADTTWANVTPVAAIPSDETALAITSSAQTFVVNTGSQLMTVTLLDQSNNVFTASSNLVVALSSSSTGGSFLSGADDVTVVSNVTIAAGSSTATFYYNDSVVGNPVVTAYSGVLAPGTQSETVLPNCNPPTAYAVTGGGAYCSTSTGADIGLSGSQTNASYQLYSNSVSVGSPIVGTGAALDFGNQLVGTYTVMGYVTASPACDVPMTGSVVTTINYPATVSSNPTNQSVLAGYPASFAVSAGNTTSPAYQWQVSANGGSSFSAITGATNASYTTAANTVANNGNEIECVITGTGGCGITTVTSSVATLAVTKATTTLGLASSVNPANAGEAITLVATVTGPGVTPSGSVTFKSGSATLGTVTLSGSLAALTTSGGVGTNTITAVYSGDANNLASTSGAVTQVFQSPATAGAAQMQEGFDYATFTESAATPTNIGPWLLSSDYTNNANGSTHVLIVAGDLSSATTPALVPLPNTDTNPAARLQVSPGATDREFLRSIGAPVTNGTAYWSFLLDVSGNPTSADEYVATMLGAGTNKYPDGTDPVTLHAKKGADSTHYNLGIQRLGGTTVFATNSLAANTTYLIVLKYTFGPSSTSDLYINPIPGDGQPFVSSASATAGGTPEPSNIGTILTYEAVDPPSDTSGTYNYDVMRADTNWYNVTPPSAPLGSGPASLVFTTAPQTFSINDGTPGLVTVTLLDQSNNVFTAVSNLTVALSSTSVGGYFLSSTDDATVITNAVIAAGSSTVSFYYNDSIAAFPVITAASGLLAPATQTETVNPPPGLLSYFTVTPSVSTTTAGSVFTATVQAYGTNGVPIVNHSVDGLIVTMTSSGSAKFDANGDGVYGDNTKALTNGAFTINVLDPKAESVTLTAAVLTNAGTSAAITITPASAAQLQVLLPGETAAPGTASGKTGTPVAQVSGTPFSVVVNLVDANYNLVSGSDTVHLAAAGDASAVLPGNAPLTGGTATLAVTDIIAGSGYTLTASDVTSGSITSSTSATYSVIPGAVTRLVLLAPGETATPSIAPGKTGTANPQLEGVAFTLTVDAFDANYNLVTASSDNVGITSSDTNAMLPANGTLAGGTKTFTITQNTAGSVTDTASDVTSGSVTVGTTTLTVNPVPKYKSVQSGNWESTNTWAFSYDGVTWTPATNTPTYLNADFIYITNGYTVTITSTEDIDQTVVSTNSTLVVNSAVTVTLNNGFGTDLDVFGTVTNAGTITSASGATINFEAGGAYVHAENGGAIPTATWNLASTCTIAGVTSTIPTDTTFGQAFGNFVWNCTNQSAEISFAGNLKNVLGNVTVASTGTSQLDLAKNGFATLLMYFGGNLNVQGGTLFIYSDSATSGTVTLEVGGNVSVTGGTLAGGTDTASSSVLVLTNAGTKTLTSGGTFSGPIQWQVASNVTLNLGTNVLGGTGTFTLEPGAGLITAKSSGFAGNISLVASNVSLSSAASYTYNGSIAQSGDTLLPATVSTLTVSNSLGVALSQAETVTNLNLNGSVSGSTITLPGGGNLTATAPSTIAASVNVDSSGLVVIASSNALPGLTIQSGTMTLGGGPITLTVLGLPLIQGTYPLVGAAAGGSVVGTLPVSATASGAGFSPAQVITPEIIGGQLYLTTVEFLALYDAGPGFSSGENLILTNGSGQSLYVWASTNASLAVSNWTSLGQMFEQNLNDGTGRSYYSINVNPVVSPTYYLAGSANAGPYLVSPVPAGILTTEDFMTFDLQEVNAGISALGVLTLSSASPPAISSSLQYGVGGFALQFSGTSGHGYTVQASTDLINWTNIGTGTFTSSPATFTDTNTTAYAQRFYRISSQ